MKEVDKAKNIKLHRPSDRQEEVLAIIRDDWKNAEQQKSQGYRHMLNKSPEQFFRDSRDHFNGYEPPPDSVEEQWKSSIFRRKTRNKVISTVASYLSSGLGIDISAINPDKLVDREMSNLADDVYEWCADRENLEYKKMIAYLVMITDGTVHLLDEIAWDTREVKQIADINFETGELTWDKKEITEFKGCRSTVISNDEMYPGDIWTCNIQDQPYVIRRKIFTKEDAERSLDKFDRWSHVQAGNKHFLGYDDNEKENDQDGDDNEVEVIWYWNKSEDRYCIVANSVLLTDPDYPIPYPHKQYPISKGVFQSFGDIDFYFGDSLPNQNWDEQTLVNQLTRMFVDATKLKNKPPLFVTNPDMVDTDLVIPGSVQSKHREDSVETIREVTQGVSQSEFNMLTVLERQMDENTVDPLVSGQAPQGDPTATEVRAVVGSAERLRSVNDQFIGSLLIQHAELRIPNALWFLTHDEDFKAITMDNVRTTTGGNGKRKIIFDSKANFPDPAEVLKLETSMKKKGNPVDFIFVDKESVNDYRFHIRISASKKTKRNSTNYLLRTIQKHRLYAQLPNIDQDRNTEELVTALGDRPDEWIKPAPIAPPVAPQGMPQMPQEQAFDVTV